MDSQAVVYAIPETGGVAGGDDWDASHHHPTEVGNATTSGYSGYSSSAGYGGNSKGSSGYGNQVRDILMKCLNARTFSL